MTWVGRRVRAVDWDAKTSGRERFTADVRLDGLLVGRVLRSPLPHADIETIDIDAARRCPGVHAVVTAADLRSGAMYEHSGGSLRDRRPLADRRVRYVGEEIVAVAAETREQADDAVRAVKIRYRRRRAVLDIDAALRTGERIHDRPSGTNVALTMEHEWGDVVAARRASTMSVTGVFTYPRVAHAPMEPNVTLARWDAEREVMDVWTSSQSPWFVADEIENICGVPADRVVCHDVSTGGGFGSKSHISEHEVLAAALSIRSGRPVLLALDRSEEFAATKPRHQFRIEASAHADAAGTICCFEAAIDVDNGAYNHYGPSVMSAGARKFGAIYRPLGVRTVSRLIDTTRTPGGQFRGYGGPQAVFAIESLVDELADRLGEDPLELRRANANRPGTVTVAGLRLGSARLVECLDLVRAEIGWDRLRSAPPRDEGVGVAVAVHGSGAHLMPGSNRAEVLISVDDDGRVDVSFGGADAGTGQRTILAQVAAQELGVDLDRVNVTMSDLRAYDLGAWSSRGTHIGAHATRKAAAELAAVLRTAAADKLGCSPDEVVVEHGVARHDGETLPLAELVAIIDGADGGRITHRGTFTDERMELVTESPTANYSASYPFAAHAAHVRVDRDTGVVTVVDYVAAHDLGRALNPTMAHGQVTGAVVQGLGAALREELLDQDGRTVNGAFVNYPLPRFADAVRVRPFLVEGPEPAGPYDAKSIGEIPILPVAPAIANAVRHATGIRFETLPLTPDRVLGALRDHERWRPRRHHLWRRPSRWQIELFRRGYRIGLKRLLVWGTRFARSLPPSPLESVDQPGDLATLAAAAGRPGTAVVGGATDVLVQRDQGLVAPVRLLATRRVPELRALTYGDDGSAVIGGAVTLAALECDERLPAFVREAIGTIASSQIREAATVAGNLLQAKRCWYFRNGFPCYKRGGWTCPCYAVTGDHRFHHAVIGAHRCQAVTPSDLASVFVALDASATLVSGRGRRVVPIAALYRGPGETVLGADEILVDVRLPAGSLRRVGRFEKLALWDGDFAVVSVVLSASLDEHGRAADCRAVYGGMAPTPWRSTAVERAVDGSRPATLDAGAVVLTFDRELDRVAHPLPGNRWKLDAAVGITRRLLTTW